MAAAKLCEYSNNLYEIGSCAGYSDRLCRVAQDAAGSVH